MLRSWIILLLAVLGCDSNPSAASNFGKVKQGAKAVQVGTMSDKRITEASGIVASRKYPGIFWTHNDGSDGVLFAIHRDGSLVGCAELGVKVHDWEDIAIDEAGNLYISDTGDNDRSRKHAEIHRLREPDPATLKLKNPKKIAVERSWRFEYPDEPQNVESLFIWQDVAYLISKGPSGSPAQLYRLDLKSEKPSAEKLGFLPIREPATAADISRDGKRVAVLTRGELLLFDLNGGDIAHLAEAEATLITVPPVQDEGCCFSGDEIVIVAESGEVFAAALP